MKYFRHLSHAKPLLVFLTLMGTAGPLAAQKQVTHQSLYFLRYYGKYQFSPKWGATLELEDRRFFRDNRNVNWIVSRVALTRSLGNGWSAAAGFTYYLADNPADPHASISLVVPELRPHEELTYRQSLGKFSLGHRYRLEERFTRKASADHLASGYDFHFRMRYQLQLAYPLIQKSTPAGTLNVKLADEVMFNLGHSVVWNSFDQNRVYLALNYGITRSVQAELGYLKWFQERSSGDQYYSRDIARLTIYHTVNFYRKKP